MKEKYLPSFNFIFLTVIILTIVLFGCKKENNSPTDEGIFEANYRGNTLPNSVVRADATDGRVTIIAEFYDEDNILLTKFVLSNLFLEDGHIQEIFSRSMAGDSIPYGLMLELAAGGDVISQVYNIPSTTPQNVQIDSILAKNLYLSFDSLLLLRDTLRDNTNPYPDSVLLTDGYISAPIRDR